jgi:hypothetical protein
MTLKLFYRVLTLHRSRLALWPIRKLAGLRHLHMLVPELQSLLSTS